MVHILKQNSPWCLALHALPPKKVIARILVKTVMDQRSEEYRRPETIWDFQIASRGCAYKQRWNTTLKTLYLIRWINWWEPKQVTQFSLWWQEHKWKHIHRPEFKKKGRHMSMYMYEYSLFWDCQISKNYILPKTHIKKCPDI